MAPCSPSPVWGSGPVLQVSMDLDIFRAPFLVAMNHSDVILIMALTISAGILPGPGDFRGLGFFPAACSFSVVNSSISVVQQGCSIPLSYAWKTI